MASFGLGFNAATAQAAGYTGITIVLGGFALSASYTSGGETVDLGSGGEDLFSSILNVLGQNVLIKTALSPDAWLVSYSIEGGGGNTTVRLKVWNPTTGAEAPATTDFSGVTLYAQIVGNALGI